MVIADQAGPLTVMLSAPLAARLRRARSRSAHYQDAVNGRSIVENVQPRARKAHRDGGAIIMACDLCRADLADDAKAQAGFKRLLASGAVTGDAQDQA